MPTVQGTEEVASRPSGYNLNVASTVGLFQPRISNPWHSNPWLLLQSVALNPWRSFAIFPENYSNL